MMRGSIRQKSKTSWQIIVDIGTGPGGKRQRHFETIRGKKSDAQIRLHELLVNLQKGIYDSPGQLTLADQLNQWLEGYVKTNCTIRTYDGYKAIIDNHLIPHLGHLKLKQLRPQAINEYYGKACEKLSTRTVHHQHRVLYQALKYAVRQGYLGRNPCELVDPPSPRKKTMRTLIPSEAEVLLNASEDSYYYPIIFTALHSGLRQAELLGLRWRDIDPDISMTISISRVLYKRRGICQFKEPKTNHSRRSVSMTPELALFLKEYRSDREAFCKRLGRDMTLDDQVFTSEKLKPIDPSVLTRAFRRIVARSEIEPLRFHDLRHSFASLALKQGVHPKIISEALGHSSVAFTMDTYSHIISGMQSEAMSLLGQALPARRPVRNSVAFLSPKVDIK